MAPLSKAWAKGSTRASRRQRARVLLRDGYACQIQLPGCLGVASHVHHKLGKGVSERDEDMCAACPPCNYAIGEPRKYAPPHKRISTW